MNYLNFGKVTSFGTVLLLATLISGCATQKPVSNSRSAPESSAPLPGATRELPPPVALPDLTEEATLPELLTYAALNSAELEAAFHRWQAALERAPQVGALPDPRLTYGYFIQEVETRIGPQEHRIGVAQTFPWFGKLALREEAANEAAAAARQQYETVKLALFDEVRQIYYELYYLDRAVETTEENLEFVRQFEQIARTKYEAGTALYADLIKAQVEVDRLKDQLASLRDIIRPTVAEMNAALNRPKDAPVPLPTAVPQAEMPFADERLIGWLLESNPQLQRLQHLAEQEETNIRLAKKEFYPDLTLGADYTVTGEARMPGVRDSGQDPVMASISINLPVWWGKLRAGVREAENRHQATVTERQDLENMLLSRLERALFRFRDSGRKIALYRDDLIPKAEQELEATQRAFEAGEVDFLSLIDSERILLEFRLTYQRAIANRGQALSALEQIVGKDLSRLEADQE